MEGKVLIVDDEPKEIFKAILEEEGLAVFLADNGAQGIAIAEVEKPDVILLDLLMPKLGGEGFLDALKQKNLLEHSGIIVVTGFDDFDVTRQRLQGKYPISFYLDKPIDQQDLIDKVRQVLEKRKGAA